MRERSGRHRSQRLGRIVLVSSVVLLAFAFVIGPTPRPATPLRPPAPGLPSWVPPPWNLPPVAVAVPHAASVEVGERLVLSAEGSHDPDGRIVAYSWSFASGNSVFMETVVVRFSESGTWDVVLTVTDDEGAADSAIATIVVLPPQPQPVLLLSAGPTNVFELLPGSEVVVELQLTAFNMEVSDLTVMVIDDGGLEVEASPLPGGAGPSESVIVPLRIRGPDRLERSLGATVLVCVRSDEVVSNVERLEVLVRVHADPVPALVDIAESVVLLGVVVLVCAALERWRKR